MNYEKSTVLFSTNTIESMRLQILSGLGVHYSINLEKYLGLPNTVGRSKKASFQVLKDRIKEKNDNWSTRFLSQVG